MFLLSTSDTDKSRQKLRRTHVSEGMRDRLFVFGTHPLTVATVQRLIAMFCP